MALSMRGFAKKRKEKQMEEQKFRGLDYKIDYVFCVDGSARMRDNILAFKAFVPTLRDKLRNRMESYGKELNRLRVKVIVFRDFAAEGNPMEVSPFYEIYGGEKDETEDFLAFVNGIEAVGGSDSSNAYEALALAMKSDWTRAGDVRRHVIQLSTNAPALPLKEREFYPGYPEDMPADFFELRELWSGKYMERRPKRMHIYAPDYPCWNEFLVWENTIVVPSGWEYYSDFELATSMNILSAL